MSRNWPGGSSQAWRRLRLRVLERDEYQCQIQLDGICTGREKWSLMGKHRAHAHHVKGREVTGDDPNWIVCACRECNLAVGSPSAQRHDPAPRPVSRW